MTLVPDSELRDVPGIPAHEYELCTAYLQGAVYCWVKNRAPEWFAVRDLVGGENADWRRTPLQAIYERHLANGRTEPEAFEAAAKDVGWIMKRILSEDAREFELDNSERVNRYRWRP